MQSTTGWLRCAHCEHPVNPRSERCDVDHPLCTGEGCQPPQARVGSAFMAGEASAASVSASAGPLYLLDIASYQRGIDLAACKAAGFHIVNIKTSQGNWYTFTDAVTYARTAAGLGLGISAFHWLDNSASGVEQARYCWQTLSAIVAAAGPVALQVDDEDPTRPADWQTLADFVAEITRLMGHRPYIYSGRWWATAAGRDTWNVASLSPWLMAAPNRGYLGSYPGGTSPHWDAGYWGFGPLAAMQYDVSPIAGAGGGQISKAALRDPAVWAAMTGGDEMSAQAESILAALASGGTTYSAADGSVQSMVPTAETWRQIDYRAATGKTLAVLTAQTSTMASTISTLADALKAGGGSVDAAAILARVDKHAADAETAAHQRYVDEQAAADRRHAEEVGELQAAHADVVKQRDAELAALKAELAALTA